MHLTSHEVNDQGTGRDLGGFRFVAPLNAAQYGADAQDELAGGKGLDQVIVRAQFQPNDAVHFFGPRRQHQDREVLGAGRLLEAAADLQAADARQHQIQDHEADPLALNRT